MSFESFSAAQTHLFHAEQALREREAQVQRLVREARTIAKEERKSAPRRSFIPRVASALGLF